MPRRRPSHRVNANAKPRPVNRKDSKLKPWNTLPDIELDDEDQFHASRDKILLDGVDDVDDVDEEEEVFALRGVSSESDNGNAEDPYEAAHDEQAMQTDADPDVEPPRSKSRPLTAARDAAKTPAIKNTSDSEGEETWGRGKGAYYWSNAAGLDSEDEEANELEEQEALRLQAKACEGMCDDDFGLGDVDVGSLDAAEQEALPIAPLSKVPQDRQSILRTLEKESPETLALARDWDDTAYNLVATRARVDALKDAHPDMLELGLEHMYYQALLTYATTLAFYLHLRATEKYAARPALLRRHPILKRLLALKEGIHTLEGLGVAQDVSDDDVDGEEEEELSGEEDADGDLWSLIKNNGLESGELADLLEDAGVSTPSPSPSPSPPPSSKRKADRTKKERLKKKHKTPAVVHGSDHRTRSPVFDLVEPEYVRPSRKNRVVPVLDTFAAADPYGEMTTLPYHDMSDKQARKKSLRFYVSRIESSSSRRTNARANTVGGDDDIPYRERRKEREARLEQERERKKEKRRIGAGGDDLDVVDVVDPEITKEERKRKRKCELDGEEADGAMGYYNLVKQNAAANKARKKAAYEAATMRPEPEPEPEHSSGQRSVTRAILKNKGLTPRRSKAVRNPRVKKRQRYEQAKKKVASQQAVYKGGIGDVSRYSGERSGISKVAKSVRL